MEYIFYLFSNRLLLDAHDDISFKVNYKEIIYFNKENTVLNYHLKYTAIVSV